MTHQLYLLSTFKFGPCGSTLGMLGLLRVPGGLLRLMLKEPEAPKHET